MSSPSEASKKNLLRIPALMALTALASLTLDASERRLEPGDEGLAAATLERFTARYRETIPTPDGSTRSQRRITHLQEASFASGDGLRYLTTMLGDGWTVSDEVQIERRTLRPVTRWVSALSLAHRLDVFANDTVRSVQMSKDGTGAESSETALGGPRFEAASLDLVLARLARHERLELEIPVFSSDLGAKARATALVRVVGRELLQLAGRSFSTHKTEIRMADEAGKPLVGPGGAPFPVVTKWISSQPPYVVRADWGSGHRIELVEVGP